MFNLILNFQNNYIRIKYVIVKASYTLLYKDITSYRFLVSLEKKK